MGEGAHNGGRILLFSDLHLHTWRQGGCTPGELPQRLLHQIDVLDQIHDINTSRQVDLNIFGGDWVHRQGEHPTEVLYATQQYFAKDRTPVLFCDGNHDLISLINPNDYQRITRIISEYGARMAEADMRTADGRSYTTTYDKIRLVFYPDKIDYEQIKGYDIVVLHKQPGMVTESGYCLEGADWHKLSQNNRLVFFAHDHSQRKLSDNCFVIGSPMHLNFGDTGDRGVYIVDTANWSVEFVKLRYPEFITIDTEDQIKHGDYYNYYRVLHPNKKIMMENVISVDTPPVFAGRIKSDDFNGILYEWLEMNDKAGDEADKYIGVLSKILVNKAQVAKHFCTGRISSVYGQNFLSLGTVEYKIQNGLTFIAGSGDDRAVGASNGAGKTTATGELLLWVFFENTTKGLTGDDVIRCRPDQQKDCVGRVVIEGSAQIVIERSRKHGLSVKVDGKDIVEGLRRPDRQKYLEEQILGFNESVFRAACYFSQKDLTMLTGMTDGDRTNMVTALLGFETYDDLYDKAFTEQKVLKQEIDGMRDAQALLDNKLAETVGKITTFKEMVEDQKQEIAKHTTERDVAAQNKAAAEADMVKVQAEAKFYNTEDYTSAIEALAAKEQAVRQLIDEAEARITKSDVPQKIQQARTDLHIHDNTARTLSAEFESYQRNAPFSKLPNAEEIAENTRAMERCNAKEEVLFEDIRKMRAEIERVRRMRQGKCANCGADITGDRIDALIKEQESKIAAAEKTQAEYKEQIAAGNEHIRTLTALGKKELLDGIECKIKDSTSAKEKLASALADLVENVMASMERERDSYRKKVQEVRDTKDELVRKREDAMSLARSAERRAADLYAKVKEYAARVDYFTSEAVKGKDHIARTEKRISELEAERAETRSAFKEAERGVLRRTDTIDRLEFWKNGFSSKGIRSVLLDRFCNEFNFLVNKYLTMTSAGTMSIVISPTSETKGGELRNKIGLAIQIGGMTSDYMALSGGEQRRVDIALCLALNEWVSEKYRLPHGLLGVIVMDELFSDLDKTGEESVAGVLAEESKKRGIIIISHTGEMASHADRVWTVTKKNHVSSLSTNEEG